MINTKNIVWREGKLFVVQCLNVDVSSFGKTKNEALKNLNEALELYFEDNKHPIFTKISSPMITESRLAYA